MNNTPILMQSEEERAPWNQKKVKCIEVTISQTLSTTTTIEVPSDLEYDSVVLEDYVREQILLPSDLKDLRSWYVDDFCVSL